MTPEGKEEREKREREIGSCPLAVNSSVLFVLSFCLANYYSLPLITKQMRCRPGPCWFPYHWFPLPRMILRGTPGNWRTLAMDWRRPREKVRTNHFHYLGANKCARTTHGFCFHEKDYSSRSLCFKILSNILDSIHHKIHTLFIQSGFPMAISACTFRMIDSRGVKRAIFALSRGISTLSVDSWVTEPLCNSKIDDYA